MTSKQEAKLSMYDAVSAFCTANNSTIALVPALQSAVTEFENTLTSLRTSAQAEIGVIAGVTDHKTQKKNELCDAAVNISAAVFAYASATGNAELKQKANYSLTDFLRLKDELLAATCSNIHDAATDNLANLADYGITLPRLTAFNLNISAYATAVPAPRNAASNRASHRTALVAYFNLADSILKTRMDKLVLQLKAAHVDFYNSYRNNRIIIDPGSSKTQLIGSVLKTGTDVAVTGATVLVVEKALSTISNALGSYSLLVPVPGLYTVKVTAAGYEEKEVASVSITLGKTTSLDVELTQLPT